MVACLEKSDDNSEFHQIVDFLSTCSINYALTVSPTIYASYIEQFWNTATSKIVNKVKQIHAIVDNKVVVILESSVRSDLLLNDEDGITCLTNAEIFENLALMGYEQLSTKLTFQKGSFSPQWKFLIHTILHCISSKSTAWNEFSTNLASAVICLAKGQKFNFSKLIFDGMLRNLDPKRFLMYLRSERVLEQPNEPPLSEGHTSGSGEGSMEQTFELTDNVPSTPYDSPFTGGYTPGSDEGRIKLDELITLCTKLLKQVLDLEKEKDAQVVEILNLKKRVKKLERKRKSSISHPRRRKYRQVKTSSDAGLDEDDASKQGRRSDKLKPMFKDKDFEELDDHMENVEEETVDAAATRVSTVSAPVSTADVTISIAEPRTPSTTTTIFDDENVTMIMAQILEKMKEQKAKEKGVVITYVEDSSRIVRPIRSITTLQPFINIDPKDKELAELERAQQERQRQEDDTNAALAKEFDEIQARIDADHELAVRLTHEEQEKYTIEERARLNRMITYLKHMGKYTHQQLKNKTYEEIQRLYEKEKRWIDDFQPMDTEAIKDSEKKVDSSSKPAGGSRKKTLARKRAGEKKSEESAKKQKLEDVAEEQESAKSDEEAATDYEHEKEELRMWLTVVSDEEETVDPMILSAKYPIVDWESQNLGSVDMEDLHVYKIIRADGNTSYHKSLSSMLRKFDRQDLVYLHRLVMKRFEDTTPEGYNLLLWGDLKKRYPLIKEMLQKMLNCKLEAEAESTMAFELLKFIKSQLEE
ncbi:hypothetical protein Tco_0655380 [Tanacetum coccineum]|uniref:Synaptobrevin, longin-like domain protein n=1 Tax=Tanacetum coccineum TaxID=301880 RepID=A0ABQ4X5V8_9ASTR